MCSCSLICRVSWIWGAGRVMQPWSSTVPRCKVVWAAGSPRCKEQAQVVFNTEPCRILRGFESFPAALLLIIDGFCFKSHFLSIFQRKHLFSSCSPQVSQSTGYFEVQLISVKNPEGQLLNGECCDAESSAAEGQCGADECDTYFRVCLKEYQTEVTTNGPCTYGSETTKVLGGNTFQFKGQKTGQNRNSDAGKIIIPFQFAWPVSATWT